MEEINLLQSRIKDTTFAWQRQGRVVNGLLTFLLILILGASGLLYYLNTQVEAELSTATEKVASLQSEFDRKQESLAEAKAFQAQVANIRTLIGSHVYLSPLLDEFSSTAYTQSQVVSLDVNEETGKVHFEGLVDNYTNLGKMILGLTTSDEFREVKLLSVLPGTGEDNNYRFSMDLFVLPEIFTKE